MRRLIWGFTGRTYYIVRNLMTQLNFVAKRFINIWKRYVISVTLGYCMATLECVMHAMYAASYLSQTFYWPYLCIFRKICYWCDFRVVACQRWNGGVYAMQHHICCKRFMDYIKYMLLVILYGIPWQCWDGMQHPICHKRFKDFILECMLLVWL